MRARLFLASLIILIGVSSSLLAATIRVPQDQPTIQAGINAATNGDTVLVNPGEYNENINFTKSIALISTGGSGETQISPLIPTARTLQAFSSTILVRGFTFSGSTSDIAVLFQQCHTTFEYNTVRDNHCTEAPIMFYGVNSEFIGSCHIDSCRIFSNSGTQYSAALILVDMREHSTITRSVFHNNTGRHGGGINLWQVKNARVSRCLIYSNTVTMYGGGIALVNGCADDTIQNNTIYQCTSTDNLGGGLYMQNTSCLAKNNIVSSCSGFGIMEGTYSYNDLFENAPANTEGGSSGPGNISANPLLWDPESAWFFFDLTSPCVNAGDPNPIYNDPGGSRNDIGAIPGQGETINVPSEFPTIQDAVDGLTLADTIVVSPGIYVENVVSLGKAFHLVGSGGAQSTIVMAKIQTRPILSYEVSIDYIPISFDFDTLAIQGLTFMNCLDTNALEFIETWSPLSIRDCDFINNHAQQNNAVVFVEDRIAEIVNCDFTNSSGTQIRTNQIFEMQIKGCHFDHNNSDALISLAGHPIVFEENYISQCAGVLLEIFGESDSYIRNNRFSRNVCPSIYRGACDGLVEYVNNNVIDSNEISGNIVEINEFVHSEGVAIFSNSIFHNSIAGHFQVQADEAVSFNYNLVFENEFGDSLRMFDFNPSDSRIFVSHNLIVGNLHSTGLALDSIPRTFPFPPFDVSNNDSWNNELGNFGGDVDSTLNMSTNPLFCDATNGNFLLAAQSPAIGIGPNGIGCVALPELELVAIEDQERLHVLPSYPKVIWYSSDILNAPQSAFEIAVGTNPDWQFAEMWNPATFPSPDTFVVYNGAPLIDGQTYYLRLRVSNNLGWSDWAEMAFRLNSLPTIPNLASPASGAAANSTQPTLVVNNSSDGEGDSLYYTFEIASDSAMTNSHAVIKKQGPAATTSVVVDIVLVENAKYFWRVKASDYYEESAYSPVRSFYVNASNSAPNHFSLTAPANLYTPPLATKTPTLQWTQSVDLDPFDTVSYSLHLALDSNFSFAHITPAITGTQFVIADPLTWGTRYWWKVKAIDLNSGETWSSQTFQFRTMKVGDNDANGIINITDIVYIINYIFANGPLPIPPQAGDVNCDDKFNITDAVYMINYIFADGPQPCAQL